MPYKLTRSGAATAVRKILEDLPPDQEVDLDALSKRIAQAAIDAESKYWKYALAFRADGATDDDVVMFFPPVSTEKQGRAIAIDAGLHRMPDGVYVKGRAVLCRVLFGTQTEYWAEYLSKREDEQSAA